MLVMDVPRIVCSGGPSITDQRNCCESKIEQISNLTKNELGHHQEEDEKDTTTEYTKCPQHVHQQKEDDERCMPRSPSVARRLNESIQFLNAVGEIQSLNSSVDNTLSVHIQDHLLCVIDGNGVTDDEDSDSEIQTDDDVQNESVSPSPQHQNDVIEGFNQNNNNIRTVSLNRVLQSNGNCTLFSSFCRLPTLTKSNRNVGDDNTANDDSYKGICPRGLEIIKRGIDRGNYSRLHRKAWLEVSDTSKHRYGKNLRFYYRHWASLNYPTNKFFDWLDSKGDAHGRPLPDIPECPRSILDSDTVLYINDFEETKKYSLSIVTNSNGYGRVLDATGEPVQTGPDGWIFVLRDNGLYASKKVTTTTSDATSSRPHKKKQRFHHSSFFGGKAVASAGIIVTDNEGFLVRLYPHSGHYRPDEADMQRILYYLCCIENVNLSTFQVDMQQLFHVSRTNTTTTTTTTITTNSTDDKICCTTMVVGGKKNKKTDCLYLQSASYVAHYLAHKALFLREGIFSQFLSRTNN